ncbi:hypothetical protein GRX03_03870 [Halovenus sp. WSH3]|uniref:Cell surface glycoprotein n=1 Tax=Halovenus carboxidivorans TaxID=2692199 RepID=A0A6B0T5B1_9EURY|nr:hypothetical protein [Halovenus carboxidivorans]MXR50743.1 hypothetical protein [Halovenus carboxidivorans]
MRRSALVICVSFSLCLLLFPTAGTPAAQRATTDDVRLSQTGVHDGVYTSYTTDGQLRVDIGSEGHGLNDDAIVTFDRLIELTYTGSGSATVWLETPVSDGYFYRSSDPEDRVDSRAAGVTLTSGESVLLGLRLDTTEIDSELEQIGGFQVVISISEARTDNPGEVPADTGGSADDPETGSGDTSGTDSNETDSDNTESDKRDSGETDSGDSGSGSANNANETPPEPVEDDRNATVGIITQVPFAGVSNAIALDLGDSADDHSPGDNGSESVVTGAETGSVTAPGTTPETVQTTLGSIRWVLLLVSGLVCGAVGAALVRLFFNMEFKKY